MRYLSSIVLALTFMLAAGCASTSSSGPDTSAAKAEGCASCAAMEGDKGCATCAAGLECAECGGEKDHAACTSCEKGETCADCAAEKAKSKSSAKPAASDEPTATIAAKGMGCPLCASSADRRLMKIDGVKWTNIDLGNGIVTVGLDPEKPAPAAADLQKAIRDAGFTAEQVTMPEGEVTQ